ncbi:hypothetical protein [Rhizobium aouanii]|uniref:Uncharacterized protein n=1 Tax=Rhizobium aouanii TaxID=3118145 RepID=A0ABU8CNU3_9HYPH
MAFQFRNLHAAARFSQRGQGDFSLRIFPDGAGFLLATDNIDNLPNDSSPHANAELDIATIGKLLEHPKYAMQVWQTPHRRGDSAGLA